MNLTIIPADGAVYLDGIAQSGLAVNAPATVTALQWKNSAGWLEFEDEEAGQKPVNQPLTELPIWATEAITLWEAAKAEKEQEVARQKAEEEEQQQLLADLIAEQEAEVAAWIAANPDVKPT